MFFSEVNVTTYFSGDDIDAMCRQMGFTRAELHAVISKVGASALSEERQAFWNPANITKEFCYRVTEAIFRAGKMPPGYRCMRKPDPDGGHYFIQHKFTGHILDVTADQYWPVGGYDYCNAVTAVLFPQLSTGAAMIMEEFGWKRFPHHKSDSQKCDLIKYDTFFTDAT